MSLLSQAVPSSEPSVNTSQCHTLCYAIVLPGRRSVFQAGFRPAQSRPSGLGAPILMFSLLESG